MNFKSIFKKFIGKEDESTKHDISALEALLDTLLKESSVTSQYGWTENKITTSQKYQEIKNEDYDFKRKLTLDLVPYLVQMKKTNEAGGFYGGKDTSSQRIAIGDFLLEGLLKQKQKLFEEDYIYLFNSYCSVKGNFRYSFKNWPVGHTSKQLERHVKEQGMSHSLKVFLQEMLTWPYFREEKNYWGSDLQKVKIRLEKLIFDSQSTDTSILPYYLSDKDALGSLVNENIQQLQKKQQEVYYQLFHLAANANGAKPTQKFLQKSKAIIEEVDNKSAYKEMLWSWMDFVIHLKETEQVHHGSWQGQEYTHSTYVFLEAQNATLMKGLVWSLVNFHDSRTLNLVTQLAERSFKKIPGVGPAAAAIGNACLYVLANSRGLEGVSHLSRLKLKVRQNNARKLIDKYIEQESKRLKISPDEVEEIAVPDFGLKDGEKSYKFDDYRLKIRLQKVGKVTQTWVKPDGSLQKSVPSFVNDSATFTRQLKKAKEEIKQIQKYSTAQRDRLERMFIREREWDLERFNSYYLAHGLVGAVTKQLIWRFKVGTTICDAIFLNNQWLDLDGNIVEGIGEGTKVRLWHPILAEPEVVLRWRRRLEQLKIQQPLKQAYREVYILTDAEINTRIYSNRMAAHLLKQHQFNSLSSLRGWKYTLMGAFDHGLDGRATFNIPGHDILAEFWLNELNDQDSYNDAGIWLYVATDQVRFSRNGEPVDLIDIPKLVFSEVMRDVDLFVGVASVGNDPQWRDNGGLPQYRDYWASYSFGDLTEVAKTRKEILERLVPKLKIKDIAKVDGRFLRVKGKIKEYKIHIGSTNILMEPNDQYLCIVPSHKQDVSTGQVFLPFEGDKGLSILLSKAFLLAEDDKITDATILSQLKLKV